MFRHLRIQGWGNSGGNQPFIHHFQSLNNMDQKITKEECIGVLSHYNTWTTSGEVGIGQLVSFSTSGQARHEFPQCNMNNNNISLIVSQMLKWHKFRVQLLRLDYMKLGIAFSLLDLPARHNIRKTHDGFPFLV